MSEQNNDGAWSFFDKKDKLSVVDKDELFNGKKYNRIKNLKEWVNNHGIPPREKSLFSQLINNKASFGERLARRLELDYGMGAGYLDSITTQQADHTPLLPNKADNTDEETIKLELFNNAISCSENNSADLIRTISFTHSAALELFGTANLSNIFLLPPDGDSMAPTIPQKSIALIKADVTDFSGSGIYYFNFQGAKFIKRLFVGKGNVIKASSDNQLYHTGDFDIFPDELEQLHIYGKLWKVMPISILDL